MEANNLSLIAPKQNQAHAIEEEHKESDPLYTTGRKNNLVEIVKKSSTKSFESNRILTSNFESNKDLISLNENFDKELTEDENTTK